MNTQCSGGSRSSAKETRALKMRSVLAGHQKLTETNRKHHQRLILLQSHRKLLKTSTSGFLQSLSVWCKLERWKGAVSGCLMSWPKIFKKNHCFEVSSSLILNNEPSLNQIACNEMWILYNNWRQWLNQKAPKLLPKPDLVVCCQSDPLQLSESGQNHYIWEVCSTNQWYVPKTAMPEASTGQQKGPNSSPRQGLTAHHTVKTSKAEELIGLQRFASSAIFTCPHKPTTTSSISTFCWENTSTTSRMQKMPPKSFSKPKAWIFMLQE